MASAWPVTLPQKPLTGSWSGGPQSNRATFQPEIGPPINRRRGSAIAHKFSGTFAGLTSTQVATFETFFQTTLADGSLPFTWNDPISGTSYDWKFADADPAYNISHRGGDLYSLDVALIRVPT